MHNELHFICYIEFLILRYSWTFQNILVYSVCYFKCTCIRSCVNNCTLFYCCHHQQLGTQVLVEIFGFLKKNIVESSSFNFTFQVTPEELFALIEIGICPLFLMVLHCDRKNSALSWAKRKLECRVSTVSLTCACFCLMTLWNDAVIFWFAVVIT